MAIEFTFDYNVWQTDENGKPRLVTADKPGEKSMSTSGDTINTRACADDFPDAADQYFGTNYTAAFECTGNFIKYVVNNNALPLKSKPPANWPSECTLF